MWEEKQPHFVGEIRPSLSLSFLAPSFAHKSRLDGGQKMKTRGKEQRCCQDAIYWGKSDLHVLRFD